MPFFIVYLTEPIRTMVPTTDQKKANLHLGAAATWAAALLSLALLLYLRPYGGIRHDSILYFGQALLAWKPDEFGQDLFFAYGSQAQYTVFPQFLAWLLNWFNPPGLFLALTLLGRLFFLLASFVLAWQLLPEKYRFWALPSLLIMPPQYGSFMILGYGETFLTGRTFAEPLILLALAAFLQRRWTVAFALWLLATLIHPLQAIPALLLAWIWLVRSDKRWLYLLAPACLAVLLGLFGLSPFDKITAQFDPEWYDWVSRANKMVFITDWNAGDWCRLLIDVFMVWLVIERANGKLKQYCQALIWGTAIAFALSFVLADLLHMILPTGLQLWRMQWLLHWTAIASLPFLLHDLYAAGKEERLRLLILVAIASITAMVIENVSPWAVLILATLFIVWPRIKASVSAGFKRALLGGLLLTLVFVAAKHVFFTVNTFLSHDANWSRYHLDLAILNHQLLIGGLVVAGLCAWQKSGKKGHAAILVVLALWTAAAACTWDRRNHWALAFESADFRTPVFGMELRPGAQVFWEDELLAPWLVLKRPSYFSAPQTAGLLFNRGTGREAFIRQDIVQTLQLQAQLCNIMNGVAQSNDACVIDEDAVREACKKSEGRLDYMVLRNKLPHGVLASWQTPFVDETQRPITYHLYQCKDFPS